MKIKFPALITILLSLIVSACINTSTIPTVAITADKNLLLATWVVIGDQGNATARVITQSLRCPDLVQDDIVNVMQVRAEPATLPQRPVALGSAGMTSEKAAGFPVLTCEAPLKPGVAHASVMGKVLPVPKAQPLKILVIGDSGCRLKAQGNAFQSCNDPEKWAFPTVVKTAATFAPDLVIHVGDYQYRESPCPANVSECADSPWGYGWDTWNADFFTPAAPLLSVAPWVMARGNHESCARAGEGWWRFLDSRPFQPGRDCIAASDDLQGDYSDPYAVPLGGDAQLILFDSSKAAGKAMAKTDPAYQIYSKEFDQVDQLAQQAGFSIFIEHHPILGFAPEKGKSGEVEVRPGNLALQSVLEASHPQRLFDPHVQLLLAGHVHLFEAITFDSDHPMQIVSGNGGSSPDVDLPPVLPANATPYPQAAVDHFNSTSKSGFMTLERASVLSPKWVMKSYDKNGALMTTCTISKEAKTCD